LPGNTGIGDVTGGTDIGILGILSKSFIWLLGSPNFTRFTLHFGIVRTAEVNGEDAPGSGDLDDLEGDFRDGEVIKSCAGGDDNVP